MKKKKLALIIVGITVVLSVFQASVINVSAQIDNALKIIPVTKKLSYEVVFPQEYFEKRIWITTSETFCDPDQTTYLNIDYQIIQRPKPKRDPIDPQCILGTNVTLDDHRLYCHENPEDLYCCYPTLCPYLSKIPVYTDPAPYTDHGIPAFHDPNDPGSIAIGTINKYHDLADEWKIDLHVPCFEGMCAQDWQHPGYEAPKELEGSDFGCDLWIEVTKIY